MYCPANFLNNTSTSCNYNDISISEEPINLIDSSIMITPELLNITNKYNEINNISSVKWL